MIQIDFTFACRIMEEAGQAESARFVQLVEEFQLGTPNKPSAISDNLYLVYGR